MRSWRLAKLADAHLGAGDVERAREHALRAVAEATGYRATECRLSLARVLLVSPGLEAEAEIELLLDDATVELERHSHHAIAPQVYTGRAALSGLRGDEEGRLQHLRKALDLYTEMGATGHAERVTRELEK